MCSITQSDNAQQYLPQRVYVSMQLWAGSIHASAFPRSVNLVLDHALTWRQPDVSMESHLSAHSAKSISAPHALFRYEPVYVTDEVAMQEEDTPVKFASIGHTILQPTLPLRCPWSIVASDRASTDIRSNVVLNSSHGKADEDYLDAVGVALLCVAAVTPGGLLVFFASYGAMDKAIRRWKDVTQVTVEERSAASQSYDAATGTDVPAFTTQRRTISLWAALRRIKRVFTEPRGSGGGAEFSDMLTTFRLVVDATADHAGHALGSSVPPRR